MFDSKGRRNTLKYYFDISDTHEGYYGSHPVPIWQMSERYEQAVIERLSDRFGDVESADLASVLMETAKNAVEDNLQDYMPQLKSCTQDSLLEELDEYNIEVIYRQLAVNSVAYMLMSRCGVDTEAVFEREDFAEIINFNTPATINALGMVKTTQKSVKTAQATSKAAIKTAEHTAKATQAAAKASVKAAQRAAQAARATAKATIVAVKAAVKVTIAAVKAIIAGTKALIAAIVAGGWVAVVVILVICLIGLLVSSVFGIFFSGEDSGNGMTMQTVVREINTEYDTRLDEIKNGTAHDVLEMSGSRAVWKEVLAVYSVKTTTDPDNPQEVATMDDNKKQLLTDIFWEMNEINSRTETKTETVITESDDGHGNIVQTETTVTRTYLYITVSHKTAEEMADKYGFNADQREQLSELLAEENNSLWSQVLYGISGGDGEIVNVALSQVGNIGGQPYWSWYGFEGRVEWCACFVSWCANECGYIDTGVIPKFAGCVLGSQWFMDRGQWQDGSFEPSAGHIIFFDWEGDGVTDHVGIVERAENGTVYTVEGNSGDTCRQNRYAIGSSVIYGYGIPAY